jgi:hypothetical protein
MALNPKTNAARRNAGLDTAFDALNSGSLRVADGTQPTDADTALGAQVSLADLTFGATAFAAASAGSKAANSITQDSAINASSTATWATLQASGVAFSGSNARIMDMSVGTSGANLNFNSVAFSSGAVCSVSSLTITQAA